MRIRINVNAALVTKIASNNFLTSAYIYPPPPPLPPTRYLLRSSGSVEKLETVILKCNLFQMNWKRSVAFIYSYSSLTYSRVITHNIFTWKKFVPTKTRWYYDTRPTRPVMEWEPRNLLHRFLSEYRWFYWMI